MEDKSTNIKERVLQIAEIKGVAKETFFKGIGMTYGNFKGKSKETPLNSNAIEVISSMYPDIDLEWLLTGKGNMLKTDSTTMSPASLGEGIPLIPVEAFAGAAANDGYAIDLDTIEDRYNIPLFHNKGVDFLMYVRGNSMQPHYNNGDVIACRFVQELIFVQWNSVYVIDTKSQGAMVKRLLPAEDPDHIICRSENPDYIDFKIPLSEINNIALVIGSVRLE